MVSWSQISVLQDPIAKQVLSPLQPVVLVTLHRHLGTLVQVSAFLVLRDTTAPWRRQSTHSSVRRVIIVPWGHRIMSFSVTRDTSVQRGATCNKIVSLEPFRQVLDKGIVTAAQLDIIVRQPVRCPLFARVDLTVQTLLGHRFHVRLEPTTHSLAEWHFLIAKSVLVENIVNSSVSARQQAIVPQDTIVASALPSRLPTTAIHST
jgi:hypothetical protein